MEDPQGRGEVARQCTMASVVVRPDGRHHRIVGEGFGKNTCAGINVGRGGDEGGDRHGEIS
ncbi:hypothetical protein [Nocardia iowensis]|uniref:Uncharacterized protein n=1 Tax=Nocardia iowensis TaxID=204891 RepID=A0ABX8S2F3_NOCIO|nr:hypothetical protein [Nocardia iowensis]QXN96145.1 hypothetical protein KV110_16860 [Nocardia iowensis]